MQKSRAISGLLIALSLLAAPSLARADLSAFVGIIGFDEEANLSGSPGMGLRWGKFGKLLGGETSLMFAFPERKLSAKDLGKDLSIEGISALDLPTTKETATAIFYEGRFLVGVPVGMIKPFADVGWGAIITTSTEAPTQIPTVTPPEGLTEEQRRKIEAANKKIEAANKALNVVSKLQHHTAFSYGVGARYGLGKMLDVRLDLRQYVVLSVKGFVAEQATKQLEEVEAKVGQNLPVPDVPDLAEKSTTLYKELSVGVALKF